MTASLASLTAVATYLVLGLTAFFTGMNSTIGWLFAAETVFLVVAVTMDIRRPWENAPTAQDIA